MSNRRAVEQALDIYRASQHGALNAEARGRALITLAEHALWSMPQIAAITGVSMYEVRKGVVKRDHTGGRFNPATLPLLLEEFAIRDRGETNDVLTFTIAERGTSELMLARLLGVELHGIRRQIRRGRVERGAA